MSRVVSAADANRNFSEILGRAVGGETVIITRHGCRLLISEDGQAGRILGGVTIFNPFEAGGAALLEAALGG